MAVHLQSQQAQSDYKNVVLCSCTKLNNFITAISTICVLESRILFKFKLERLVIDRKTQTLFFIDCKIKKDLH